MDDPAEIKKLVQHKSRYLAKLKERQARQGIETPPGVLIDIEDLEAEIEALKEQLAAAGSAESGAVVSPDNPFYTGGRINDPQHFFGRQPLVREIRGELKKRSSVSLVGEPQLGKSSLLYYLYATRAEWLPGVSLAYIDLQGILDEQDFCETVLARLESEGHSLRQLKKALARREVERLAEADFNPRLHDLLRSLAQEPHFAMCLATQRPLVDLFPTRAPGGVSPFHNIFSSKHIGPFSQTEARAFLETRLAAAGVAFSPTQIERLISDSQGHPAKLQAMAKALFAEKLSSAE